MSLDLKNLTNEDIFGSDMQPKSLEEIIYVYINECIYKLNTNFHYHYRNKNYDEKYDIDLLNQIKYIYRLQKYTIIKKSYINKLVYTVCKNDLIKSFEFLINNFDISINNIFLEKDYIYHMYNENISLLHLCVINDSEKCFNFLLDKKPNIHIYRTFEKNDNLENYIKYHTIIEDACLTKRITGNNHYLKTVILKGCKLVTGYNQDILEFSKIKNLDCEVDIFYFLLERNRIIKNIIIKNTVLDNYLIDDIIKYL
jgi:hypothetical protein